MVDSVASMTRLWLVFAQTVTVAVAVLFVVATFRPEWLPSRSLPGVAVLPAPAPAAAVTAAVRATSYHEAVQRATPSVVNIFTSKEVQPERHPLLQDPLFRRFFGEQLPDEAQRAASLGSGVIVSTSGYIITNHHVVEAADDGGRDDEVAPRVADILGIGHGHAIGKVLLVRRGGKPAIVTSAPPKVHDSARKSLS